MIYIHFSSLNNSRVIDQFLLMDKNKILESKLAQREAELALINAVQEGILSKNTMPVIYELIGDHLNDLFEAQVTGIMTFDYNTQLEHFEDLADVRLLNTLANSLSIALENARLFNETTRLLSEADQRLLSTIAANVGIAIQNAEAYKKLQEALNNLKEAQSQLVQQEKLDSLGQLTAGIAHEIKNPLNFVNNFSGVSLELIEELHEALDKTDLEEARAIAAVIEGNLTRIHQHGTRADGIVQSMLQHSRGGDGKKVLTNLNALVKEYVNLAYHGMRANKNPIVVDISFDLDENLKPVSLVAEDFSRVILDLCNNAFDAMREWSEKNRDKSDAEKAVLSVKTRGNGQHVTIDIRDNGPGIPDEIKDKILQPFFTTKKGTQGTGLGLSITHDIIKAHGGTLQIESKVNSGSMFSIALPI